MSGDNQAKFLPLGMSLCFCFVRQLSGHGFKMGHNHVHPHFSVLVGFQGVPIRRCVMDEVEATYLNKVRTIIKFIQYTTDFILFILYILL